MKKILFLFVLKRSNTHKDNKQKLLELLKPNLSSDIQLDYSFYEDLIYAVADGKASIYDTRNNCDLADYDLVEFRFWHKAAEEAASCAEYLKQKSKQFIDTEVGEYRSKSKHSETMRLWANGVAIPDTIMCGAHTIEKALQLHPTFEFPLIIKDIDASKGDNNYLVQDLDELKKVYIDHPALRFMVQRFVPNDGDYRVLVFGDQLGGAIERTPADNSTHLNNTSQNGNAKWIDATDLPDDVGLLAIKAAKSVRREIAGVDVVRDKISKQLSVFEVNGTPMIDFGSHVDKKIEAMAKYLNEILENK